MAMTVLFDPAFDNSGQHPLKVPGHGLPIDYIPYIEGAGRFEGRFRHGADDFRASRMVVREIAMLQMVNEITEKPFWERKVFDNDIVAKWRSEAVQQPDMSEAASDWILRELHEKAAFSLKNHFATVLDNASTCVKSDRLVPKNLQQEFKEATEPLLNLPNPDWHPHSNEQVRNLVHPSLFPLVYGKSQVLKSGTVDLANCTKQAGQTEPTTVPDNPWEGLANWDDRSSLWSRKFQWLPCEVKFVGDSGTDVKITSYINNLHPVKYPSVYQAVEKLISLSIAPWNETLIYGHQGRYPSRIKTFGVDFLEDASTPEWASGLARMDDIPEEIWEKIWEYMELPDGPHYDPSNERYNEEIPDDLEELESYEVFEAICAKTRRMRTFIFPDPGQTYEEWKDGIIKPVVAGSAYSMVQRHKFFTVDLEKDFRDRGLQVIVKIAGIELTPEKPTYPGGNWHLEGMVSEHIVATSIYYYDVENITESGIRFRQEAELDSLDLSYEQDDYKPLETIFGTRMTQESAVQELGQIKTIDGRFIAFPNTLQHCVQPFELEDKTKSGHRRFVVLWLVDPHYRVMSTANVPPQQQDWWEEEARNKYGPNLPAEITDMIMGNIKDWPMGLDEAKKVRLELMEERTEFGRGVDEYTRQYSLCEH